MEDHKHRIPTPVFFGILALVALGAVLFASTIAIITVVCGLLWLVVIRNNGYDLVGAAVFVAAMVLSVLISSAALSFFVPMFLLALTASVPPLYRDKEGKLRVHNADNSFSSWLFPEHPSDDASSATGAGGTHIIAIFLLIAIVCMI